MLARAMIISVLHPVRRSTSAQLRDALYSQVLRRLVATALHENDSSGIVNSRFA